MRRESVFIPGLASRRRRISDVLIIDVYVDGTGTEKLEEGFDGGGGAVSPDDRRLKVTEMTM